jgi:hypothetical protein
VVNSMHESSADKRRGNVADGSHDSSPKLTTCKAGSARCYIIDSGTHAAGIGEHCAQSDETAKCDREPRPKLLYSPTPAANPAKTLLLMAIDLVPIKRACRKRKTNRGPRALPRKHSAGKVSA